MWFSPLPASLVEPLYRPFSLVLQPHLLRPQSLELLSPELGCQRSPWKQPADRTSTAISNGYQLVSITYCFRSYYRESRSIALKTLWLKGVKKGQILSWRCSGAGWSRFLRNCTQTDTGVRTSPTSTNKWRKTGELSDRLQLWLWRWWGWRKIVGLIHRKNLTKRQCDEHRMHIKNAMYTEVSFFAHLWFGPYERQNHRKQHEAIEQSQHD